MTKNLFDVADQLIVITGGMGQLGRQFAGVLIENGAKVAILDDRVGKTEPDAALQSAIADGNCLLLQADVTDKHSIEEALTQVQDRWGVPHGLINSAAIDSPPDAPAGDNGPFEAYSLQSWDKVMNVNVKGVFLACQVIGNCMAKEKRGSIINISSIYGIVSPDQRIYEYRLKSGERFFKPVAYSVSKSALLNLTRYLATYWAASGIRVNTLTFGGVFNHQDKEFLHGYCQRVPLGRMAQENEYNGAIIFLLSGASSYMTGANLVIDGGWTAW